MGFFSRVSTGIGSMFRREADADTSIDRFFRDEWSQPSLTGININQTTALRASAVMACVTMIAEDVAKLSWGIFKRNNDKSRAEAQDHFLYTLLEEPNEWQNGLEFREQMQLGLIMRGNAYAPIVRNARGKPIKLIPVNPDWVSLWQSPDGSLFYRVTRTDLHMQAQLAPLPLLIPFEDMFHIRGFSLNGLVGLSRISLAREAIGLSLAQEQQSARWMGNGARPSGILTTDGKLGEAAAKRMQQDWLNMHSGLQNSGKTAVFEQGLKWQAMSLSASDMEFIESRRFQVTDVARIFRVPPHMIGDLTKSTNNNITQQSQEYVNYTLSGYTRRWQAKYSSTFGLRAGNYFVECDFSELTRADIVARYNAYRTGIMSMFITPDEARIDDGRAPMGGKAAELQVPTNMAAQGSQSTGTGADDAGRPANGETV